MSTRRNKKTSSKSSKSSSKSRDRSSTPKRKANSDELPQGVMPNDILKAYEESGTKAFRIDVGRTKKHTNKQKQTTRYIPFEVNINGEWTPVALKFQGVKTEGGVKPPEKRRYGPSLTFKQSSTFTRTDRKTKKEVVERYGEAVVACNDVFVKIASRLVKKGELKNGKNNAVLEFVQKQRRTDPNDENSDLVDMDDFIFRPKLPVGRETGEFTIAQGIRDLRKKIPKDKRSKGQLPYELAKDEEGVALNPANVHTFIKMATPCFGVHDLSQACCSKQGISVPSSVTLLMAKKPKGLKPTFDKYFDEDEMEEWGDVEAYEEGGDEDEAEGSPGNDGSEEEGDAGEYGDAMDAVDGSEDEDDIEDPASEEEIAGDDESGSGSEEGSVEDEDLDSSDE